MSQSSTSSNEDENVIITKILMDFFQKSTRALEECTIDRPMSTMNEIRSLILYEQTDCLQHVVNNYYNKDRTENNNNNYGIEITVEQVQNALRELPSTSNNPELLQAMSSMDNTARFAFTRLVLQSEYYWELATVDRNLNTSNPMKREDILEFCALCTLAVQLPNIQQHLLKGTPLFTATTKEQQEQQQQQNTTSSSSSKPTTTFPDQRLHTIQRMILQALGYDPEHGKNEIKRLFFSGNSTEFSDDVEVIQTFNDMATAMNTTLTNITMQSTNELFLSDHNDGGCTRIVSVTYSEKIIGNDDPSLQNNDITDDTTLPPISQVIDNATDPDEKRNTLHMAGEANRLQQEILGQLLLMPADEREIMLQNAKLQSDQFIQQARMIPSREDRIYYLQSIDEESKKLMMMYKLWDGMLAANNGKPPTIHYNN